MEAGTRRQIVSGGGAPITSQRLRWRRQLLGGARRGADLYAVATGTQNSQLK